MKATSVLRSSLVALAVAAGAVALPSAASAADQPISPGFSDVFDPATKPCWSKIKTPSFCLPDFSVDVSSAWTYRTVRHGQSASFFYMTVQNHNVVGGSSLFTTVGIDEGDIIEVEPVWGDLNVSSFPIPELGSNSTWVVEHDDGLAQDEFTVFRVWVAGHGAFDFGATTNHHVGVEYYGYERPAQYPQRDGVYWNNTDHDSLGFG